MALCERGRLDLDEPVITYIPDLQLASPEATETITLRHLLSHQAGFWGDWFDDFGLADDAIVRFVAEYHQLPQMFEPGSLWAYNNCGYILAGLVAATEAGSTFEEALKTILLDPLGMDHTFLAAADAIAYPVAVGHTNDPNDGSATIARQFLRPRARNPAGGVLASIEDVLTFAELHLGRANGLLTEDARLSMRSPQAPTFEANASWGLGFKIEDVGGRILVGHGGATNGFRAQLEMVPEDGFAVAVLTNSDSGSQFTGEIVDWSLEQRLGTERPALLAIDLPEAQMDHLSGTFRQPYATIEIARSGSTLTGQITTHSPYSENSDPVTGDRFELDYIGDDRFIVGGGELEGSQIKYWMHDGGAIRFLQAGGRLYLPGEWVSGEGATT